MTPVLQAFLIRFAMPVLYGALVVVLSTGMAHAATPETLSDLLRQAVDSHPDVRNKKSELQAARFGLEGAQWGRYPSFTTEIQSRTSSAMSVNSPPQSVAKLEQSLWTGGHITGQIDLSKAGVAVAEAALIEAEQSVLQQTAQAYFDTLRFEARLTIAQANEAELQRLLDIIKRRVQAEVSPMTDETQASARLRQAVIDRIQTQRQIDSARLMLYQMLGKPVGALASPPLMNLGTSTQDSLVEEAFSFSPERHRLQAQVETADAQIEIARAQLMPKVVVGVQSVVGSLYANQDRTRTYLALQLQTGAGLSGLSAVETAVAHKQAAQDAILTFERQLTQQVKSNWTEAQALSEQLEPVRALLAGSDEIVASYLRQFQVGRKSWLDVLNAQRERVQAIYGLADVELPFLLLKVKLMLQSGQLKAEQTSLN
jgi:adhesin transport system outer membrane protein